ncbi:unnamed protein product [Caenorhabditis sp. 36 PRJEB53466]|nr:unnamed protein product [Caenorhabditis sp. 36 PRJEB53466]
MSSKVIGFTVFEENNDEKVRSEFACQTEEIALGEEEAQTVEGAVPNNENSTSEDNTEISYWETVVANQKKEIKRIEMINEKMEEEKLKKTKQLEEKKAEYARLFDLANEKLSKAREDEDDEIDEEDVDEEDETADTI